MSEESIPLGIVPIYIAKPEHATLLEKMLASIRNPETTEGDLDILIVDDCSPMTGAKQIIEQLAKTYKCDVAFKPENTGFAKTVNIGLRKAFKEDRVAILINQDLEFIQKDWLANGLADPAGVVGARLIYSNHLIQHGGVFFSILNRHWDHLYRFAPFNLKEVNVRANVIVTGALQFIKPETIGKVGLYDENFKMAYEDVDYCIRAFDAGVEVAYNPKILAIHHETMIRGDRDNAKAAQWYHESLAYMHHKYQEVSLTQYCNPIDRKRGKEIREKENEDRENSTVVS